MPQSGRRSYGCFIAYSPVVRRGQDHWMHDAIPIVLALVVMYFLVRMFIAFLHADW